MTLSDQVRSIFDGYTSERRYQADDGACSYPDDEAENDRAVMNSALEILRAHDLPEIPYPDGSTEEQRMTRAAKAEEEKRLAELEGFRQQHAPWMTIEQLEAAQRRNKR